VPILANLWSNKMDEAMKGVIAGCLIFFSWLLLKNLFEWLYKVVDKHYPD
jgi:hypothetical protein